MRATALLLLCLIGGAAEAQMRPPPEPSRTPAGTLAIDSRAPRPETWRDVSNIRERIDRGRDAGALSRRDARGLKREARRLERLAGRHGRDGVSASEQRELDMRVHVLREQANLRRLDGAGRGGRR